MIWVTNQGTALAHGTAQGTAQGTARVMLVTGQETAGSGPRCQSLSARKPSLQSAATLQGQTMEPARDPLWTAAALDPRRQSETVARAL